MQLKPLLALAAGASMPLAFAPFYFYPVAVIALCLVFFTWYKAKPWQAFGYGWLYGLGLFGVGVSWIFVSMHRFGGMSVPLAGLFTALFTMAMALFPAMQGLVIQRLFPGPSISKLLLALPVSMGLMDWLRSWLFSGFPWLLLGYSQTNSPLRGFAPIIGEYGLAFVVSLLSALLLLSLMQTSSRKLKTLSLVAIFLLGALGWGLSRINWTKPEKTPIQVSLVQGNIPQQLKWEADFLQPTLHRYLNLTREHWHSDLIVWPEGAIPTTYREAKDFMQQLAQQAQQAHSSLLVGMLEEADDSHYFNALYLLGAKSGHYFKRQLVPYGEYLPFPRLLTWLLDLWQIPVSSMLPGPLNHTSLPFNGFSLAPFICYEIAYAKLVEMIPANTGFLVVISNDAWFGDSLAPPQHLQIAQFRALSTQRPTLVATNSGITAIIDAQGKLVQKLAQDQTAVLSGQVTPRQGNTPLLIVRSPLIILALLILLGLALRLKTKL